MNIGRTSYSSSTDRGDLARIVNIALGVWLFISAFAWQHTSAQMTNTWIMGVLAAIFGLVAMFVQNNARYLNTAVAVWLFISAFALPTLNSGTVWNNVIVSIAMFACSLVPGGRRTSGIGTRRAALT